MKIFLFIVIIFAEYIISAYSTTDISRQLAGASHPVLSRHSYCPACGHSLSLTDQLPIISYYIRKGRCGYCGAPIPPLDHRLETGLFMGFALITIVLKPTAAAFCLIVTVYEAVKAVCILRFGMRSDGRLSAAIGSLAMNAFIFLLLGFYFLLYQSL